MSITTLQLHKRSVYVYEEIQDRYAIAASCAAFALADGTTQSFQSARWAELITHAFVTAPEFDRQKLLAQLAATACVFDAMPYVFSSNPAKASLERSKKAKGATATLIGAQVQDGHLRVISCGDSNLFVLDSEGLRGVLFESDDALDANKTFLNTVALREEPENIEFQQHLVSLEHDATYILATDALSRLLLHHPAVIHDLLAVRNFDDLLDLCVLHWEKRTLEEDDISAVVFRPSQGASITEIRPPAGFEFSKEEEAAFVPYSFENSEHEIFSPMQMQEIENQFAIIRKKQSRQEALSLITLFLLLCGMLVLAYMAFSTDRETDQPQQPKERVAPVEHRQRAAEVPIEREQTDETVSEGTVASPREETRTTSQVLPKKVNQPAPAPKKKVERAGSTKDTADVSNDR